MARNGVSFRKNHLSPNKYSLKSPYKMNPRGITIHNTANDASAENEVAYMIRNDSSTGFHRAVDGKEVVEGIPTDRNAWANGDGSNGYGNRNHISYEICYSKSGGIRYDQAETNAIMDIAYEMKIRGWDISDIKKHQDWSGKFCPHRILGKTRGWEGILKAIEDELNRLKGKNITTNTSKKPKPKPKPTPKPKNYYQKGDTGSQVKSIQNNLIKHGFSVGSYGTDGVYGVATVKAVRAFQKAKGLKVDGVAGVKTIAALKKKTKAKPKVKYPLPDKVLQFGSRGNDVKQLQRALNAANFKVGAVDGIYGAKTRDAVRRFQSVYDAYNVDGIYGARTRARLNKKVN